MLQSPNSSPTNEVLVDESKVTRNVAAYDGAEKSDVVAGNEKLRRSIPSTIDVDTPRRKSVMRSEETDLNTLLTVSNVVEDIVDRTVLNEFPESVKEVDTKYVREICFELEKEEEDVTVDDDNHHSWKLLSNVYELLHYRDNVVHGADTTELEKAIDQHVETINSLLHEKSKHELQIDGLQKSLFQKDQQLKIMADRVKQLEDSSSLRNEVVRLEAVLEQRDLEIRNLNEDLSTKVEKIKALEERQVVMTELKTNSKKQTLKIKELEEQLGRIKDPEESGEEMLELKEVLEDYDSRLDAQEEELRNYLEKVRILEENKMYLMNENTILKNEAKLRQSQMTDNEEGAEQEQLEPVVAKDPSPHTEMREELNSIRTELKKFQEYTFGKLDKLSEKVDIPSSCASPEDEQQRVQQQQPSQEQQEQQHQQQQQQQSENQVPEGGNYYWAPNGTRTPPSDSPTQRNVVPGLILYSQSHLWSTMIISDSMPTKINYNVIKKNIDTNEETAILKKFPGHTADEIAYYATKPLSDHKPNQVIVIAGTNDLSRDVFRGNTVNEYEVVESLMKIARTAREFGAYRVYVSGIMTRHGQQYKNPIARVNNLLQYRCSLEGFLYMDQSDISSDHVSSDGVHLNFHGQTLLKMNILSCFNTFNPYFNDFENDYELSKF